MSTSKHDTPSFTTIESRQNDHNPSETHRTLHQKRHSLNNLTFMYSLTKPTTPLASVKQEHTTTTNSTPHVPPPHLPDSKLLTFGHQNFFTKHALSQKKSHISNVESKTSGSTDTPKSSSGSSNSSSRRSCESQNSMSESSTNNASTSPSTPPPPSSSLPTVNASSPISHASSVEKSKSKGPLNNFSKQPANGFVLPDLHSRQRTKSGNNTRPKSGNCNYSYNNHHASHLDNASHSFSPSSSSSSSSSSSTSSLSNNQPTKILNTSVQRCRKPSNLSKMSVSSTFKPRPQSAADRLEADQNYHDKHHPFLSLRNTFHHHKHTASTDLDTKNSKKSRPSTKEKSRKSTPETQPLTSPVSPSSHNSQEPTKLIAPPVETTFPTFNSVNTKKHDFFTTNKESTPYRPNTPKTFLDSDPDSNSPNSSSYDQAYKTQKAAKYANILLSIKLATDGCAPTQDVKRAVSAGTSALHGIHSVDISQFCRNPPPINGKAFGPNHANPNLSTLNESLNDAFPVSSPFAQTISSSADDAQNSLIQQQQLLIKQQQEQLLKQEQLIKKLNDPSAVPSTPSKTPINKDVNNLRQQEGDPFQIQPTVTTSDPPGGTPSGYSPSSKSRNTLFSQPDDVVGNVTPSLFQANKLRNEHNPVSSVSPDRPVMLISRETLIRAERAKAVLELRYSLVRAFQGDPSWWYQQVDPEKLKTDQNVPIFTQYNPLQTIRNRSFRPRRIQPSSSALDRTSSVSSNDRRSSHFGPHEYNSYHHHRHHTLRSSDSDSDSNNNNTFKYFGPQYDPHSEYFWNVDVYELISDFNWRLTQYNLMKDRNGNPVFPGRKSTSVSYHFEPVSYLDSQRDSFYHSDNEDSTNISKMIEPLNEDSDAQSDDANHYAENSNASSSSNLIHSTKPVFAKLQDRLRQTISKSRNGSVDLTADLSNSDGQNSSKSAGSLRPSSPVVLEPRPATSPVLQDSSNNQLYLTPTNTTNKSNTSGSSSSRNGISAGSSSNNLSLLGHIKLQSPDRRHSVAGSVHLPTQKQQKSEITTPDSNPSSRPRSQSQSPLSGVASETKPVTPVLMLNNQKIDPETNELTRTSVVKPSASNDTLHMDDPKLNPLTFNSSTSTLESSTKPDDSRRNSATLSYNTNSTFSSKFLNATQKPSSPLCKEIISSMNDAAECEQVQEVCSKLDSELVTTKCSPMDHQAIIEKQKNKVLFSYAYELRFLDLVFLMRYISISHSVQVFSNYFSFDLLNCIANESRLKYKLSRFKSATSTTNNSNSSLPETQTNKPLKSALKNSPFTNTTTEEIQQLKKALANEIDKEPMYLNCINYTQPLMIPSQVRKEQVDHMIAEVERTTSVVFKDIIPKAKSNMSDYDYQINTLRRTKLSTTSTRLENLLVNSDQTLNKLSTTLNLEVKKVNERLTHLERKCKMRNCFGVVSNYQQQRHRNRNHKSRSGRHKRKTDSSSSKLYPSTTTMSSYGPGVMTIIGYALLEYTVVFCMWVIWGIVSIFLGFKSIALKIWKILRWLTGR